VLEEERKYQVEPGWTLPDVGEALPPGGSVLPRPPATLRATYFDTADLRLARAGVSLRHRRGDDRPWTVKLPTGRVGVRQSDGDAGLRQRPEVRPVPCLVDPHDPRHRCPFLRFARTAMVTRRSGR